MADDSSRSDASEQRWIRLERKTFRNAAIIGGLLTVVVLVALSLTAALVEAASAKLWIDVVTKSLTVLAGAGGAFGLWLAYRRQQAQEHRDIKDVEQARRDYERQTEADRDARRDATERRITDRRVSAVEQLGSASSTVRIGGLHNLELLGEQYPEHRQIILDEICAYLRMPFTPPGLEPDGPRAELGADGVLRLREPVMDHAAAADAKREAEVRRTAQRILERHLREKTDAGRQRYWVHSRLDLTGARLDELDLSGARLCDLRLAGAVFDCAVKFDDAEFNGHTDFTDVRFSKDAEFNGARFSGRAGFGNAVFADRAWFNAVTFSDHAWFNSARFERGAEFAGATFKGLAWFTGVTFANLVAFDSARFDSRAEFGGAMFEDLAWFTGVSFNSSVWFGDVHFGGRAAFGDAGFHGAAVFSAAVFTANTSFDKAKALLRGDHVWPSGWELTAFDGDPEWGTVTQVDPR